MAPRVRPAGYEPPRRSSGGTSGELANAARLAQQNPGAWIDVHEPRRMSNPPSTWCSEVNGGNKELLDKLARPGERWEAGYEESYEDGKRLYVKMIRFVPSSAVTDAAALQPESPVTVPPSAPVAVQGSEH